MTTAPTTSSSPIPPIFIERHDRDSEDRGRMPSQDERGRLSIQEDRGRMALQDDRGRLSLQEERGRMAIQEERRRMSIQEDKGRLSFHEERGRMSVQEDRAAVLARLAEDRVAVHTRMSEDRGSIFGRMSDERGSIFSRMSEDRGVLGRMSEDRGSMLGRMSEDRGSMLGRMSEDRGSMLGRMSEDRGSVFGRMSEDRGSVLGRMSEDRGSVLSRIDPDRLSILSKLSDNQIFARLPLDRGCGHDSRLSGALDSRLSVDKSCGYDPRLSLGSFGGDRPCSVHDSRLSVERERAYTHDGRLSVTDDRDRRSSDDRSRERDSDRERERSRERGKDGDWKDERDGRRSAGARSSVSSNDSDTHTTVMSMSKRWTTLETVGRCMFLFSVAFFIVGVLITVFGFSNTGMARRQQMTLQILGPSCLAMTVVMWVIGCVFSRLWNLEWKRQQHAFDLRDRVQLHALAMDILNNPVISPGMLQDPNLRRQLLLKLRAQKTLDLARSDLESRRSSRAFSLDSRRRYSSAQYEKLLAADRKKSTTSYDFKPTFELPGIQISRIETLDFGDSRASLASCSTRSRSSRQYIIIHSDLASDFSRLSCPSDYSLAGSRSSRSRGSRASSQLSSRLWDFSPRESDWDADISLGSRESQLSVLRADWGGGTDYYQDDCLSPRKLSVVTFDTSPTVRRHSSPAFANRRKESNTSECTCGRGQEYPTSIMRGRDMSCHSLRFSDGVRIVETTAARKRSADLISCRSMRIQEDEREHIPQPSDYKDTQSSDNATQTQVQPPPPPTQQPQPPLKERTRPPLRRNNTDDSEVERRVARLFKEIEYSVSESVDESKVHSFSSEFDYCGRRVEAKEAQTQTMTETEMKLLEVTESDGRGSEASRKNSSANSWSENTHSQSHDSEMGAEGDGSKGTDKAKGKGKKKGRSFEKTISTITHALSALGRRSSSAERRARLQEQRVLPCRSLLKLGLSFDAGDEDEGLEEAASARKAAPPTYEDVVNKNL